MRYRKPVDMLALCSALALLLYALQHFTISKFSALDSAGYISLGYFLEDARDKIQFDALDAVLGLGVVVVFAALVVLEGLRRRLTMLLGWICASDRRAQWAVVLIGMVAVRYYFARGGMYWGGDASAQLAYAKNSRRFAGGGRVADLEQLPGVRHALSTILRFSVFLSGGFGRFCLPRLLSIGKSRLGGMPYRLGVGHIRFCAAGDAFAAGGTGRRAGIYAELLACAAGVGDGSLSVGGGLCLVAAAVLGL